MCIGCLLCDFACGKIGVGSDNGAKTLVPAMAGVKFLGRADDVAKTARIVEATADGAKTVNAFADGAREVETFDDTYDAAKAADLTALPKRDSLLSKTTNPKMKEEIN